MQPTRRYYLDGMDMWTVFGIIVQSGSDDFLKYPAKKDSITHDWSDADGLDVDTSRVFFKERDVTLKFFMMVPDEITFWKNYQAFIAQWRKPGTHRIQLAEFGLRSFFVIYKDTTAAKRYTRIKETQGRIVASFSIRMTETEPNVSLQDVFIVDEDGRFIVT